MNKTPPKPVLPPPPSRSRLAAIAPPPSAAPDNLSKPTEDTKDLNFKVDADFHRRFKLVATMRGMSMKELLEACFYEWVQNHGESPPQQDFFK